MDAQHHCAKKLLRSSLTPLESQSFYCPQMNASLRGAWVNIQNVDANKVYVISCCIAYWLDSMGYGDDFKKNLKSLLASYPQVDPAQLAFLKIRIPSLYGDR